MNEVIKKVFNLEYSEVLLVVFFSLICSFLIWAIIIIVEERIKVIKHKKTIVLLSLFPSFFLLLVYFNIFKLEEWLGFLGGYFGVVGTIYTVIWQNNESKREKYSQIDNHIKYIVKENFSRFNSNMVIFQKYLYKKYKYKFHNESLEVRKDKFSFINFNDSFIENNLEYILTLEDSNQILQLYNIIKELNKTLYLFLESCEKREKEFLIYFEYSNEGERFKKNLSDFIKQPYDDYTKELFPNGIIVNIEEVFSWYRYLQFSMSVYYRSLENLNIQNKIIFIEKYSENILTEILGINKEVKKILEDVYLLEKKDIYIFNLKYTELFLTIENNLLSKIDHLIFSNFLQFWGASKIYDDYLEKRNKYYDYIFWMKKFNSLLLDYYKILLELNNRYNS